MTLIEVTMKQSYLGRDVYNVFHYDTQASNDLNLNKFEQLHDKFKSTVADKINAVQNGGVTNVSLKIVAVANTNLQRTASLAGEGAGTDTNTLWLPRAQTMGFRLSVDPSLILANSNPYTGTRRITGGFKYFTGVEEGYITNGDWTTAFAEGSAVDDLEEALFAPLTGFTGGAPNALPLVLGRAIAATDALPARDALYAYINGAQLQPPTWLHKRKG